MYMSYYPSVIPDLIGNPHLPFNAQPRAILLTRVAPPGVKSYPSDASICGNYQVF